ncbi:hypothetical protein PROFUN_00660 [Planoprotostelium fungivorum]|uniref:Uncharacterized protein n=1 Tax=Planoprotostelium fungivorum TaxID=1890364 RepID=A0A2P6NU07_9EUKA|nr:hypothetical protein PROFUN_00660 [Planoprotostelium fungivorum]
MRGGITSTNREVLSHETHTVTRAAPLSYRAITAIDPRRMQRLSGVLPVQTTILRPPHRCRCAHLFADNITQATQPSKEGIDSYFDLDSFTTAVCEAIHNEHTATAPTAHNNKEDQIWIEFTDGLVEEEVQGGPMKRRVERREKERRPKSTEEERGGKRLKSLEERFPFKHIILATANIKKAVMKIVDTSDMLRFFEQRNFNLPNEYRREKGKLKRKKRVVYEAEEGQKKRRRTNSNYNHHVVDRRPVATDEETFEMNYELDVLNEPPNLAHRLSPIRIGDPMTLTSFTCNSDSGVIHCPSSHLTEESPVVHYTLEPTLDELTLRLSTRSNPRSRRNLPNDAFKRILFKTIRSSIHLKRLEEEIHQQTDKQTACILNRLQSRTARPPISPTWNYQSVLFPEREDQKNIIQREAVLTENSAEDGEHAQTIKGTLGQKIQTIDAYHRFLYHPLFFQITLDQQKRDADAFSELSSDRIMELEQKLAEAEKRCSEMRESLNKYMNQIQSSAAGDMVVRRVHCVTEPPQEAATWSFPDENNIILEKVNLIRAMFYNGEMLNILHNGFAKEHILNDSQSPFCSVEINIPPNLLDNLPPNLRPTHLQMVLIILHRSPPMACFHRSTLICSDSHREENEDVLCADMHDNREVNTSPRNTGFSWTAQVHQLVKITDSDPLFPRRGMTFKAYLKIRFGDIARLLVGHFMFLMLTHKGAACRKVHTSCDKCEELFARSRLKSSQHDLVHVASEEKYLVKSHRYDNPSQRESNNHQSDQVMDELFLDWDFRSVLLPATDAFFSSSNRGTNSSEPLSSPPGSLDPSIVPDPPSLASIEREEFNKVTHGVGLTCEPVWREYNKTVTQLRDFCTSKQKKQLWDEYRNGLNESIKSADDIQAYAEATGFPQGDPGDHLTIFEMSPKQALVDVIKFIPTLITTRQIEKFSIMNYEVSCVDGKVARMAMHVTVKRDVFGLINYFVAHGIFHHDHTSPLQPQLIAAYDGQGKPTRFDDERLTLHEVRTHSSALLLDVREKPDGLHKEIEKSSERATETQFATFDPKNSDNVTLILKIHNQTSSIPPFVDRSGLRVPKKPRSGLSI